MLFNQVNDEAEWSKGLPPPNSQQQQQSTSVVLNPATLNRIVENSVMASTFAHSDDLSANVGFEVDEKVSPGGRHEGVKMNTLKFSLLRRHGF